MKHSSRAAQGPLLTSLASLGLAACAGSYHVPSSVQGSTPLIIANQTATPLCSFKMAPLGATASEEWIGVIKPQPATAKKLEVRPGVYMVAVKGCQDNFAGAMARVEISGPTNLTLTPTNDPMSADAQKLSEVAGFTHVVVPVAMSYAYLHPPVYAAPAGGGEGGAAANGESEGGGDDSGASSEGASSDDSSSSSESSQSQSQSEPEKKDCLPYGATTDNYHKCCDDSFQTNGSDQDKNIYVCG